MSTGNLPLKAFSADEAGSGGNASHRLLSAVLQHIPECVFIKDPQGRYLMLNKAMAALLGCQDPSEVIGKTDDQFLAPEKARSIRLEENRILDTGLPMEERNEFIRNSQKSAWYSMRKQPLFDDAGRLSGILGVGVDISEKILNENRERASSQDLKAVVDIADRLIASNDLDTLLRKAVELARSHLRIERCSILLNHEEYLRGTYGTDLQGRTTDERTHTIELDAAWKHRFRIWNRKSSQWIIERDIQRSSPDARSAMAQDFWVATTPIKGSNNRVIAVFCNDTVISGAPPNEHLQDVIAVYCSLLGNIIERQTTIDELKKRDRVLEGVASAASRLLTEESLDEAVNAALRVLGVSLEVDRTYLFKNYRDPLTGEWFMSRIYEWASESVEPQLDNPDLHNLAYQPVFTKAFDGLSSGHIYGGPTNRLSREERTFLEQQGIVSFLLVPVFIEDKFWGLIGFDDCRRPREWTNFEKTTLLTMAGNFGGAITQDLTETELKARDRILSGVARANHELLTNPNLDEAIEQSLRILASAINAERVYVGENHLDADGEPVLCPRYIYDKRVDECARSLTHDRHLSYRQHLPGWYRVMSAGKPIHGRIIDFLAEGGSDVRSMLMAPLVIEKKFWGIIGFDSPDPEHNWSDSDVSTLATMAGGVGGAIARTRAEDSLRTSEEHFRSLIENASDIIAVVDARGVILYGSPSVERELGYTISALSSVTFFDLVHPEDQATAQRWFHADSFEKGAALQRLRLRHARGDWLITECAIMTIPGETDQKRYVVNARDVTQRVKTEEALRRSEELLRHSQKMEAIGRLAGGISHDFNNLLTAILGYGDLLLDQIPAENEWRQEVEEIHNAARRAHSLTRQLLAFSRRQVMEPKHVDLNLVVADLERLLKRLIGEDVSLVTAIDPAPCPVKVDRSQIEQVIINLCLNSRDAMATGGELFIRTENITVPRPITQGMITVNPGPYAVLRVRDTGHGISDDIRPHIFEPFFTTKEVGKGTGLGLSMVYGTVEQSGGHILFESEVGKGTEFSIYLPRVEATSEPAEKIVPAAQRRGSETILLIEDDKIVRELSLRILINQGYHVIAMDNGQNGLTYFKENAGSIDLVLTDIIMPVMSGVAFARAARQIKPDLRVLYMSGYSEDNQPADHETDDGRNYIQKPFTVSMLCSRIRQILDSPAGIAAQPS